MTRPTVLRPFGADYDQFLYEYVGEDGSGAEVTALSMFARLGVDPWKEASELAGLPEDAARSRLCATMSKCRDMSFQPQDHREIARRLIALLPRPASRGVVASGGSPPDPQRPSSGAQFYLIAMIVLVLAQILLFVSSISGE